jgi:hypothetical protein
MKVLEAIQAANTTAIGADSLSFANLREFQSFQDSFEFDDYPRNIVLPFDSNGTTNSNGIRKAVIPLQGWILTRVSEDTNDWRSLEMETTYLEPMRDLAIAFLKELYRSEIIDHMRSAEITDVIRPEYMFLNAHLFGVNYTVQLPIIQNVC